MRGGVVDHDPTEGLPVRRWEFQEVTIKQDPKGEDKDEDGKEGSNPNWPWPDLPLPKDFNLLPPHSQVCLTHHFYPPRTFCILLMVCRNSFVAPVHLTRILTPQSSTMKQANTNAQTSIPTIRPQ